MFEDLFQGVDNAALAVGACGAAAAWLQVRCLGRNREYLLLDAIVRGEHVVDVSAPKAAGRSAKVGREECCCIAVPHPNPGEHAADLILKLTAQLFDVLVDHFLIDLESTRLRVEMQHPPSDLSFGQRVAHVDCHEIG